MNCGLCEESTGDQSVAGLICMVLLSNCKRCGAPLMELGTELKIQVLHESLQESQSSQAAHAMCGGLRRASDG